MAYPFWPSSRGLPSSRPNTGTCGISQYVMPVFSSTRKILPSCQFSASSLGDLNSTITYPPSAANLTPSNSAPSGSGSFKASFMEERGFNVQGYWFFSSCNLLRFHWKLSCHLLSGSSSLQPDIINAVKIPKKSKIKSYKNSFLFVKKNLFIYTY